MPIWKYLKQAGLLVALVLAATQIWDWLTKPSQRLEADVSYGWFQMPPQVDSLLQLNQRIAAGDWILPSVEKGVTEAEVPEKSASRAASRVTLHVRQDLRDIVPTRLPLSAALLNGYWKVVVRNGGSQPLTAVRLVLPSATFVLIEREGVAPQTHEVDATIDLATVHPGEIVTIKAWAKSEPRRPSDEQVRLTHSSGTGTVSFQHAAGAVGQFVDRYWGPLLFGLPWAFFFVFAAFSGDQRRRASGKQESESAAASGDA